MLAMHRVLGGGGGSGVQGSGFSEVSGFAGFPGLSGALGLRWYGRVDVRVRRRRGSLRAAAKFKWLTELGHACLYIYRD